MSRFPKARIAAIAAAVASAVCTNAGAGVRDQIDTILKDPYLKNVSAGIKIVKAGTDAAATTTVYEHNATTPLTPASNLKLVTTAAALETLGADFAFQTRLLQKENTLALIGDGDPTLGDSDALKKVDWQSTTLFQKWAEGLAGRGLKSADGLLYDDSIFDQDYVSKNWPADQLLLDYVAGVAGLNFNANCLNVYLKPREAGQTVDYALDPPTTFFSITNTCLKGTRNAVNLGRGTSPNSIDIKGQTNAANIEPIAITVEDPPAYTAAVLRDVFKSAGIVIDGKIQRDPTIRANAQGWQTLAINNTPIAQVISRANKFSINLYAEALAKRLGAEVSHQPGSRANGTAAIGAFLQSIGVPVGEFSLDDGCGLSRKNAISAASLVAVIEHEYFSKNREVYLNSLAVAGQDGTFKTRFASLRARDRVIGKSGFIDGVSALSGVFTSRDGSTYIFSILLNGIGKGTNGTAKQVQERIVMALEQ